MTVPVAGGTANIEDVTRLIAKSGGTLEISSGVVTVTPNSGHGFYVVAAESGTSDDVDTVNGLSDGELVAFIADTGDTITYKNGTGNLDIPGDIVIADNQIIILRYDGANLSVIASVPVLDEDNFTSDSPTQPPSQQSTRAYITGKQKIWIPVGAMRPAETNGCEAVEGHETTAGRPDIIHMAFDNSTEQHAQFSIEFPKGWNAGTLTFQPKWTGLVAGAGGVAWGLQAVAAGDDDTIDVAFGTAVVVTDTFIVAEDNHRTSESSALTVGGSPADGDTVFFDIFRKVSDAADTRAAAANLMGITLYFTTDAPTDD